MEQLKSLEILKNNTKISKYVEPNHLRKAIKELEELQNRSCNKCKYVFDNLGNTGFCEYNDKTLNNGFEVDYIDNVDDFYCSRFEAK